MSPPSEVETSTTGVREGASRALAGIVRLNITASRGLSDEVLFREAIEVVDSVLSPSRSAVLLKDAAGVMRFVVHRRLSEAYRAAVEGHSPWGPEEACPLPVLVADALGDPHLAPFHPLLEREGIRALAFIPLVANGMLLGKFMLYFDAPHVFTDVEIELAQVVASHIAFVVGRRSIEEQLERDVAQTRRVERRLRLLAGAGEVLLRETEPARMLEEIARLAAGTLSDLCLVDLLGEDETWSRVAVAAASEEKRALLEALREYPPEPGSAQPAGATLQSGMPVFLPQMGPEDLRRICRDPRHLELLRALGPVSGVAVPLLLSGAPFGALSFYWAESGREYDEGDVVCFQDLARRVAVALENAQLKDELGEAVRARDEFLSIASHELRTPLTALKLQLDALMLARHAPDVTEPVRGKLENAERQLRRVNKLVEELLEVSRISAGRMQLERERVDVAALVADVARRMEPELLRAGCPLTIDAQGPAMALADRLRMELLVSNLLSNALKYGAGSAVSVAVRRAEEGVVLTVRDGGIGIAPEHLTRIFDRFERMVSSRNFGGFGLGLWIVRQVADAHGGTVRAESALGQGATFEVQLPADLMVEARAAG